MSKFLHADFDKLVEETVAQIKTLSDLKGGEYAGDNDRLANFRRNGDNLGIPMEVIWYVYTAKHWDAIAQYVRDLSEGKTRQRLESLSERFDDLIVYAILGKAMLIERERETTTQHHPV